MGFVVLSITIQLSRSWRLSLQLQSQKTPMLSLDPIGVRLPCLFVCYLYPLPATGSLFRSLKLVYYTDFTLPVKGFRKLIFPLPSPFSRTSPYLTNPLPLLSRVPKELNWILVKMVGNLPVYSYTSIPSLLKGVVSLVTNADLVIGSLLKSKPRAFCLDR